MFFFIKKKTCCSADRNFRYHRTDLYPASWLVPEYLGSLGTCFGPVWTVSALHGWDSEQKSDVRQSNSIDTSTQLFRRRSTHPFNKDGGRLADVSFLVGSPPNLRYLGASTPLKARVSLTFCEVSSPKCCFSRLFNQKS